MITKHSFRQILVVSTAVLGVLAFGGAVMYEKHLFQESSVYKVVPGVAELILFEDFRCYGCRMFNEKILPQIESHYGQLSQVHMNYVPLGLLKDSKPLANAALQVLKHSPDQFPAYAHKLFEYFAAADVDESVSKILLQVAEPISGINLEALKACIESQCHYEELDQNLQRARDMMGRRVNIPALYVNGRAMNTENFQAIQKYIDQAIK